MLESSCRAEVTGTSGLCQGPPDRLAEAPEQDGISVFQALCFGYFHLSQQMKVTRPPGRNPGAASRSEDIRTEAQSTAVAEAVVLPDRKSKQKNRRTEVLRTSESAASC